MTDEPAESSATPEKLPPPERARVEASARRRVDPLPLLYLLGLLVLAGSLYFLYSHPPASRLAPQEASRIEELQGEVQSLHEQIAQLERRPAAQANTSELQNRVAALESRPAPAASPQAAPVDLQPLTARVDALEKRPAPDLGPLTQRIEALEKKPPVDVGPLSARVDQLAAANRDSAAQIGQRLDAIDARIAAVDAQAKQTASGLQAIDRRAQVASRLQGASAALAAGQKLPEIPGAPPALARFTTEAPPTEASLRLSFDRYADAAQKASQPAIMDNQDLGTRMWNRAQQMVTVRQGDRVLLGDPIAGVLAHAREALEAGDLQGAVKSLDGLAGPAAAAMKPWTDQARALLDARAAIASMAAS